MTFAQLRSVLDQCNLSPEILAPKLGVANMTIRRWRTERSSKHVPKSYERAVVEGIYQLIIEGHLDSRAPAVEALLSNSVSLSFDAVIKVLGISDIHKSTGLHEDKMAVALYQIGASKDRKSEVDQSNARLGTLKKMGAEWNRRITLLWRVVRSAKLSPIDKFVAYGALFYLICPFDLIPDQIPVIGFIDDFGVLGFAITFYLRKFPDVVKSQRAADGV